MNSIAQQFKHKNPNCKEFHNIKPFTLEWWMWFEWRVREELDVAIGAHDSAMVSFGFNSTVALKHEKDIRRYRELSDWIRQRIIKKYGESNNNPNGG